MTSAMSSRGTRIFMGPIWTSKASPSSMRTTVPVRPRDLSLTVSPSVMRGDVGLGVLVAAVGAGGVRDDGGLNCSRNSRRSVAMRRSASLRASARRRGPGWR